MNKLLSDKAIIAFKRLPPILWYLIFAISSFFANSYDILVNSRGVIEDMSKGYIEAGLTVNTLGITIMTAIMMPIISTLIFEIIAKYSYVAVNRRYGIGSNIGQKDTVFRLRLVIILANLIIGCVQIAYFFYKPMIGITSAVLNFSVITLLLYFFYEVYRKQFLNNRLHAQVFSFVARVYFLIFLLVSGFNFISTIVYTKSVMVILTISFDLVTKLIWAGLAYWKYTKLKAIEHDEDRFEPTIKVFSNTFTIPKEKDPFDDLFGGSSNKDKENKDDIFKDF